MASPGSLFGTAAAPESDPSADPKAGANGTGETFPRLAGRSSLLAVPSPRLASDMISHCKILSHSIEFSPLVSEILGVLGRVLDV